MNWSVQAIACSTVVGISSSFCQKQPFWFGAIHLVQSVPTALGSLHIPTWVYDKIEWVQLLKPTLEQAVSA